MLLAIALSPSCRGRLSAATATLTSVWQLYYGLTKLYTTLLPDLQAVGRLGQDSTQLRALRQQLEQEQLARAAAESKAELLRNKLREVAERSKARGNTLASVVSAVRRVADAKQQLSSAEADLQQALQDAEVFLQVRLSCGECYAVSCSVQHVMLTSASKDTCRRLGPLAVPGFTTLRLPSTSLAA